MASKEQNAKRTKRADFQVIGKGEYEHNGRRIEKDPAGGYVLKVGNALSFRANTPYGVAQRADAAGY